ncbi:MAG: SPOR domain-containing protein [Gammaproteobacteria bacterium]
MNQNLKQRLVGAIVLVVLGIIVLPLILEKPVTNEDLPKVTDIEVKPEIKYQPYQDAHPTSTIPQEVFSRYEEGDDEDEQNNPRETQQKTQTATPKQIVKEEKLGNTNSISNKASENLEKKVEKKISKKVEGKAQWALQIASFSSKENASRLAKRLKSEKLTAYFEGVPTNAKTLYRVRIGPIDSKLEIEKLKKRIDQKEKLQTLIVTLD